MSLKSSIGNGLSKLGNFAKKLGIRGCTAGVVGMTATAIAGALGMPLPVLGAASKLTTRYSAISTGAGALTETLGNKIA